AAFFAGAFFTAAFFAAAFFEAAFFAVLAAAALPAPFCLRAAASARALSLAATSFFFVVPTRLPAALATLRAPSPTVRVAFFAVLPTFRATFRAVTATDPAASAIVAVTPLPLLIGVFLVWLRAPCPRGGI